MWEQLCDRAYLCERPDEVAVDRCSERHVAADFVECVLEERRHGEELTEQRRDAGATMEGPGADRARPRVREHVCEDRPSLRGFAGGDVLIRGVDPAPERVGE